MLLLALPGKLQPKTKRALQQERRRLQQQEQFPCALTKALNDEVAFRFMPSSRSAGTWSRLGSWMQKFRVFADEVCRLSGKVRTLDQNAASSVMCRHFIAKIAGESTGVTRPRSARAALTKYRIKRGWGSLSRDDAISAIVAGTEAEQPRTKKQSAGFSLLVVQSVVKGWGESSSWWERQVATIMSLGFVSLMRLGEICRLRRSGVRVVFADGSECDLLTLRKLPDVRRIKGLLFHLPWRKNHADQDCWVPVACKVTMRLVFNQVRTLRSKRCRNECLFPSRVWSKAGKCPMNSSNWVGEQSWVKAMREALLSCVPLMTPTWARQYSGHAMRVGGSNHMRKIGVADEVHRKMGGWMTLVAAQGYMDMSPAERFRYTTRLAGSGVRRAALTAGAARAAMPCLPALS